MKAYLRKVGKHLVPDTDEDAEKLSKYRQGAVLSAEVKQPRNYEFHKKAFALVNYAYDCWEPESVESPHGEVQKNREQFREDVTILAGYYEQHVRLDGSIRTVAKSWSFGSMKQEEFDAMYSALVQVVLSRVLTNYTRADLDHVVEEVLRFAA